MSAASIRPAAPATVAPEAAPREMEPDDVILYVRDLLRDLRASLRDISGRQNMAIQGSIARDALTHVARCYELLDTIPDNADYSREAAAARTLRRDVKAAEQIFDNHVYFARGRR
jgi:hypothetical protein